MRKIYSFLALMLLTLVGATGAWAQVKSLDDVSETKVYTVSCVRGTWWANVDAGTMSNVADPATVEDPTTLQFAFVQDEDGATYIYSVAAKKFVMPQRGLLAMKTMPIKITEVSWKGHTAKIQERDGKQACNLGGTATGNFTWDTYSTTDDGCALTIAEVADVEFDPAEAKAILAENVHYFDQHKVYTISTKRGDWTADATHSFLSTTYKQTPDAPEADKQFAFYYKNGSMYIYNVGSKKFLQAPAENKNYNITPLFAGKGSPASMRVLNGNPNPDGDYKYYLMFAINENTNYVFNAQEGISNGSCFSVNDWTGVDNGNRQKIEEVADLDVYEEMDRVFNTVIIPVTYNVVYKGEVVASTTVDAAVGTAPELPAALVTDVCEYAYDVETIAEETTVINATATYIDAFPIADDLASAKWVNLTLRDERFWIAASEDEPYVPTAATKDQRMGDAYQWALVGNPYNLKLYNKAFPDKTLKNDNGNVVMRDGETGWVLFNLTRENEDGTFEPRMILREAGTANNYINQYGGVNAQGVGGKLGTWNSSYGRTDFGSSIGVEEVPNYNGDYYIQNVSSGLYLTGNNSWGTQGSVGKAGVEWNVEVLTSGGYALKHPSIVGTANVWLGANLYCDSTTPDGGWVIAKQEDGTFTIALGDKYLAQSATIGTNNEPVVELVDEIADAAKWVFLTKEEAVAALAAATEEAPVDATFLLSNPGFNRNVSTAAWTAESGNKNLSGGTNDNRCAESWQASFNIYQTISVPNGKYRLTAQAALTDYTGAYDGADYPVVYANNKTSVFCNMEEADRDTGMNLLSNSFVAGKYAVEPIEVLVSGGTLTVGVRGTRTNTWCIWDNFQLVYLRQMNGEEWKPALEAAIAEAEAIEGLPAAADAELKAVVEKGKAVTDETTSDEYEALIAEISEATTVAKVQLADYNDYVAVRDAVVVAVATASEKCNGNKADFDAVVTAQDAEVAALPLAGNCAAPKAAVLAAGKAYVSTITRITEALDITDLIITNATPTANADGWTVTNAAGEPANVNGFSSGNGNAEFWNQAGHSLKQTLPALPVGSYTLTAVAYTRTGMTALLSANENSKEIATVGSDVVNNLGQGKTWMDEGNGVNVLEFTLEEQGDVTIGLTADAENADYWLVWRSFNLVLNSIPDPVLTNLDFSLSTPVRAGVRTYAKDIVADTEETSGMQEVEGWTIVENGDARAAAVYAYGTEPFLGGEGYAAPATNPAGKAEGQALGLVAVWSASLQYTQPVALEAGQYALTTAVYNSVGGSNVPKKSLIGFIAEDGTEHLAEAKAYAVNQWSDELVVFTLEEKTFGVLSLGYEAQNVGSGSSQHLFFDNVKVQKVTDEELAVIQARIALKAALAEANAHNATLVVGDNLFQVSTEAEATYVGVIAAQQAVCDNAEATLAELTAAIEALEAGRVAVNAGTNKPVAGGLYTFQLANVEPAVFLNIEDGVKVQAEATKLMFVEDAENVGQYFLTDAEAKAYVGLAGGNIWTMSNEAEKKAAWTFTYQEDGTYVINNQVTAGRVIGLDENAAGSSCWADKKAGADNTSWIITYDSLNGIDAAKADLNGDAQIFDLSGRKLGKVQKGGVYLINGKKVAVK